MDRAARLAWTPGNVVPVADYSENQNQSSDDQQTCSFQRINTRAGPSRLLVAFRHGIIVAPRMLNYAALRLCHCRLSSRAGQIFRFGVFEADLSAGELRKNGAKIRLQEQPFQILAYLAGRPGELVTRQDLRDKLWSNDTFVDFDHSLNTAINKLREALGDSASSPRFVETVARRGYRFLAPVEEVRISRRPPLNGNRQAIADVSLSIPNWKSRSPAVL